METLLPLLIVLISMLGIIESSVLGVPGGIRSYFFAGIIVGVGSLWAMTAIYS